MINVWEKKRIPSGPIWSGIVRDFLMSFLENAAQFALLNQCKFVLPLFKGFIPFYVRSMKK